MYASKPRFIKRNDCCYVFTKDTRFIRIPEAVSGIMRAFSGADSAKQSLILESVEAVSPIPQDIKDEIIADGKPFTADSEGFVIKVNNGTAKIFADTEAGIFAGCMTLLHHLEEQGASRVLSFSLLWDYPQSRTRGVKLFIPGREYIGFFKEFIDLMVFFRCNTMMLEIGGAMEYKRHPEINERWETYSAEMMEYSGKSTQIQEWTYPWYKNSIHSQNGNGSWLTQDELRELAAYCAERGIEVIPEVPCTSHCDYLVIPHPEIAERSNDPYPDTFCPSNPASYELLFDIFDEVIEVFNPKTINIGHDEYYSIGICDRCKGKDAADILADDIIKIHDYLKEKGVRTMMWSDKIMNINRGNGAGGAEVKMYKAWDPNLEFQGIIPATWRAIYKIPKDILCLNWYWGFGPEYDHIYTDHGFDVVFGNFSGSGMRNYRERCADNVSGGLVSNWSETSEPYLKRNGVYFEMAYNSFLFWDAESCDEKFFDYVHASFEALYAYKYRDRLSAKPGTYIEITHSTNKKVPHEQLSDGYFIDNAKYAVGSYEIIYEDGTVAYLPVSVGDNIADSELDWNEPNPAEQATGERTPESGGGGEFSRRLSSEIRDVAFTVMPKKKNGKTVYTYLARNPYSDKKIKSVEFRLPENADWTVTVENISFR